MPYIVALSGGIASGKSTVADLFAKLGVPIVDADIIAKKVVAKGSQALEQIVHYFGQDILLSDGNLNRAKLREIIFNHQQHRAWLNQYLHPIIQRETTLQISRLNTPYILWVVPLLIENNLQKQANRILIIDTDVSTQIKRLTNRDNISEDLAKNMLLSQTNNEKRISYADDVIVNNGDTSELSSQVMLLHNKYLKLSQNYNEELS
ncbi:dephospho-CoA kinase [Orbus sturtevantii]|uniref:dephospho-CoA kinase n=1 Tax=Orbus sturtevantii TaxID=3074109 RepID=UPI00370D8DD2